MERKSEFAEVIEALNMTCEKIREIDGLSMDEVNEEYLLYLKKARFRLARYADILLYEKIGEHNMQDIHDELERLYKLAGGGNTRQLVKDRDAKEGA